MFNVLSAAVLTRRLISVELGRSLLRCFVDSEGGFFYPSHCGDVETGTPAFSEKKLDEFAELLCGSFLYIAGRKSRKWEGLMEFLPADARRKRKDPFARITVRVLEKNITTPAMMDSLAGLALDLSVTAAADYARIEYKRADQPDDLDLKKGLPGLYWWNYLGEPYVELFGKEKLLSAPSFQNREIKGAVLLLSTETYGETLEPGFNDTSEKIKKHLGARAFRSGRKPLLGAKTPKFDFP